MSRPFSAFAMNWFRVRESKGIDRATIAARLGLGIEEYIHIFESGERVPGRQLIIDGCSFMGIESARAFRWISYATEVPEIPGLPLQGAQNYIKPLIEAFARVEARYEKNSQKKIAKAQKDIIAGIKRDVLKLFTLPILPMNYILIREEFDSVDRNKIKFLHDIKNFILDGESLAGFIARDSYFGLFCFYAANALYFSEAPAKNVVNCLNQLTIDQFETLFLIATYHHNLYKVDEEIPILQQINDFTSLAALMVQELESFLPDNVNKDHLYHTALAQGLGKYTLFCVLHPHLAKKGSEAAGEDTGLILGLDDNLFSCIITELHTLVSCMIAANWDLPKEVLDTLRDRHNQPAKEVSPLCATLKIVNEYVDSDFPVMTQDEVAGILARFPQVKIDSDVLYKITGKLQKVKKKLYERSSQLIEQKVQDAAPYIDERIRKKYEQRSEDAPKLVFTHPPKRHEFRFDTGLQGLLLKDAYKYHLNFVQHMLSPRKTENISNFQKRAGSFFLKMEFVLGKDIEVVAQKANMSVDEVMKLVIEG